MVGWGGVWGREDGKRKLQAREEKEQGRENESITDNDQKSVHLLAERTRQNFLVVPLLRVLLRVAPLLPSFAPSCSPYSEFCSELLPFLRVLIRVAPLTPRFAPSCSPYSEFCSELLPLLRVLLRVAPLPPSFAPSCSPYSEVCSELLPLLRVLLRVAPLTPSFTPSCSPSSEFCCELSNCSDRVIRPGLASTRSEFSTVLTSTYWK